MGWDPARDSPDGSILSLQLTAPGEGVCLSRPLPGEQGAGAGRGLCGARQKCWGTSRHRHPLQPQTIALCSPRPSIAFCNPKLPPFAARNHRPLQPHSITLSQPQTITSCSPRPSPFATPNHRPLQPHSIPLCSPIATLSPSPSLPRGPRLPHHRCRRPPSPPRWQAPLGPAGTGTPGQGFFFGSLLPSASWQRRQPGEAKPVWGGPALHP